MSNRMRKAATIAVASGLLLGAGAAAPALAASGSPPGAVHSHHLSDTSTDTQSRQPGVVHRVSAFWDQYKSAVLGTNPVMNPEEVRGEFLTPELNAELDAWAEANQADPVFRAQNVPVDRTVRYEGSGMGYASVVVTQYWEDGSANDVWYRVPLDGSRIVGLQDPPV
ncbi:hypothetical protein [Yinghuangia sp. YIM S09857]|uniref:hypothetical protein n=1 Tax=Yinghuangia sp. YIM S09857 TaxID=3436929 RepID=UPI003F53AAD7